MENDFRNDWVPTKDLEWKKFKLKDEDEEA